MLPCLVFVIIEDVSRVFYEVQCGLAKQKMLMLKEKRNRGRGRPLYNTGRLLGESLIQGEVFEACLDCREYHSELTSNV